MKIFGASLLIWMSLFAGISCQAMAQVELHAVSETVSQIEYTKSELASFGFTDQDFQEYTKRLQSIEGKWWGHLTPMELMMYSAKSDAERRRFAMMYLSTHNPKAQAERKAAIAMYRVARNLMAEELSQSLTAHSATSLSLFVNANCSDCDGEVKSIVESAIQKVDIYLTELNSEKDMTSQLVSWASKLELPPHKVSLNNDNGIFKRSYGYELDRLKVLSE